MKIIANIDGGFLIEAAEKEVREILRSVHGTIPDKIKRGQKIPAIDYASTITKLKDLPSEYEYKNLLSSVRDFNESLRELTDAVEKATGI